MDARTAPQSPWPLAIAIGLVISVPVSLVAPAMGVVGFAVGVLLVLALWLYAYSGTTAAPRRSHGPRRSPARNRP